MRIPVIIDCDPGHDDAIAIIWAVASKKFDIKAITTVAGNQTLEKVSRNALGVLSVLDITDIPVAAGYDRPMVMPLQIGGQIVHGESGLEGPEFPELKISLLKDHAIELIHRTVSEADEKITLIGLGPLTNIAMFLQMYPECSEKIEQIAIMGGGTFGNFTPAAEYNIWADPEAAHVVFNSGIKVLMAGLDVTQKAYVTRDENEIIRAIGNKTSTFVAELIDFFSKYHYEVEGFPGCTLHDPTTIAALAYPDMFEIQDLNVDVELHGELTRGMTVVDEIDYQKKIFNIETKKNTAFIKSVNRNSFVDRLIEDLRSL